MSIQSTYRPHDPGHDYYEAGAYLITLVVTERERCLSVLNNDTKDPDVVLTDTGRIVKEEWDKTTAIQASKGCYIETRWQVCMPDHWHGVIIVRQRMNKSLGSIINAFKSVCTSRWRKEVTGYVQPPCTASMIRHMSKEHRRSYYASRPRIERPLFDDDYDDTICIDTDHLLRMIHYVTDNPRRAIIMRIMPQFFERCMHVVIDGMDYAAFGNLFLLRWATKIQVFCHRKARIGQLTTEERSRYGYTYPAVPEAVTRIPYQDTAAFQKEKEHCMAQVMRGATVVVTPGISKGEEIIKNECIERFIPLIHIQKDPIGPLWKPEFSRFNACQHGTLLILAPWHLDALGAFNGVPVNTNYSRFHNLNTLAQRICQFDGEARILR